MALIRCAFSLCVCLVAVAPAFAAGPLEAEQLRCEYRVDPIGIAARNPRLGWIVNGDGRNRHATAYQVLVATSESNLNSDDGDLWDSGKTADDARPHVVYDGESLTSETQCWWKVRMWNEDDEPGPWSEPAHWSMGLLAPADWVATWIGFDAPHPDRETPHKPIDIAENQWYLANAIESTKTLYVRGAFETAKDALPERAGITLSAGNQFTLYVNGQQIGSSDGRYNARLRPQFFDLTPAIVPGENVVAIESEGGANIPAVIGKIRLDGPVDASRTIDIDDRWKGSSTTPKTDDWRGRVFDDSAWTFLEQEDISAELTPTDGVLDILPAPYLRKEFAVDGKIVRATLYASALGLYELRLNGVPVTDDVLAPGWTDYNKRVYYRTYDVTRAVRGGQNALGVILAPGWYSGYLGWDPDPAFYGEKPRALMQLKIEFADDSESIIHTDETWKAAFGPITGADLYMGEHYDARAEMPGWAEPDFDDEEWHPVATGKEVEPKLEAHPGVPVRRTMELPAKSISEPEPGVYIADLGQNMVGWIRLRVNGETGQTVTIRYGEMLNPDGTLYTENLRGARAIDTYTLRGGGDEIWEPRFTFHGFQYAELRGISEKPANADVIGVVVHSDMAVTGAFECSNPLLNQLQSNIVWGQRGNFLEVPTDCPQRDERMGWLGDAQVFCETACFNMNTAPFFTKWMQDVVDAQFPDGAFPMVAPLMADIGPGPAGWGDAGVIIPWTMYQIYGDRRILETYYDEMKAFIAYMHETSDGFIRGNNIFGDWLSLGKPTSPELISTAFFAYSTGLMSKIADTLDKDNDAAQFRVLRDRVCEAFVRTYVNDDGRIEGDTQTGYVLALHFDLVPDTLREAVANHLVNAIEREGFHITTGFIGSPYIAQVLSETGHLETAYALLMQDTYPSWLYPVTQGATTIWERWDGWRRDAGFQDPAMNSFNHYAYGAIGNWMYRTIVGIQPDPENPGYARAIIRPQPGGGLTFAKGHFDSVYGRYSCDWRVEDGRIALQVSIPANTRATVYVPTSDPAAVDSAGIAPNRREENAAVFDLGSGTYEFAAPWK